MMDIIIYQINLSRDDDRVAYLGLSQLDKFQGSSEVNSGIYDKVFEGAVEVDTLEGVYQMFNCDCPETYLGVQLRRVYYSLRFAPRNVTPDWEEWRTNMLASAVLMPKDLILQYMREYGLGKKMRMVNRIFAARQYEAFSQIADKMGVSKTALAIRMKQLGLVDRNDLNNPYSLIDICCDETDR